MNMQSSNHPRTRLITLLSSLWLFGTANIAQPQSCVSDANLREGTPQVLAPSFLNAWIAKYPTSTLPVRMETLTGRNCNVCHQPPSLNAPGNCYRDAIAELLNQGMTIEDALNQLDTADSDGDGVSNGQEALAPRPEAGQVGYSPGLIGDFGTDPCATNPAASVTGMPETPASAPVPAVSTWSLVAFIILLATGASFVIRKRAHCV